MSTTLADITREDGLRMITKRMHHTKRIRLAIISNIGSAYDPPEHDGLAHFFEHMAFKGTPSRSASQINSFLGQYLLGYNASTNKLETTYWGEAVYRRFQELCDILFDVYLNSTFPESEIEIEKGVVYAELARNEDSDGHKSYEALAEILWRNNPQRKYGGGTRRGVESINRNLLLKMHKKWHAPSSTVIVATGKIDYAELNERADKLFPLGASPPNKEKIERKKWDDESEEPPSKKEEIIERPERKKAIIRIGCKIPKTDDKTRDALDILNSMIGGGTDSLLKEEIREKRGLAYSVGSYFGTPHHQLGYGFFFTAEVLPENAEDAKKIMFDVICNQPLDAGHFRRQKEAQDDYWIAAMEDPLDWEWHIITRVLKEGKDSSFLDNYAQKQRRMISEIQYEEVVELREKFLTPERLACAIIKPA